MKPCISCSKSTRRPHTHQQELHRASWRWTEKFVLNWIPTKQKQVTKRTLRWTKIPSTNRNSRITMMPNIAPNNTTTKSMMQYSSRERSGGTNPFWAICLHSYPAAQQGTSHKKANHPTFRHLIGNHSKPKHSTAVNALPNRPSSAKTQPSIHFWWTLEGLDKVNNELWPAITSENTSSMFVVNLNKELDHNCKWKFETRLKWRFKLQ